MKTLNVMQGSPQWHIERAKRFTASEASAMMGVSKYMSRNDLLKQKATGIVPEVTHAQQALFNKGHAAEDLARPFAEEMIDDELYPTTGVDDIYLASFDGITMTGETCWEHKLWNEKLAEAVRLVDIPETHYWQLEHQLMVSGAEQVLFMVSNGTKEQMVQCWYSPVKGRREALVAGWEQFATDLSNYTPQEVNVAAVGVATNELPAITYKMDGLQLHSNLDVYKIAALQLVEDSRLPLESDQDFADREVLCKTFKDAEQKIKTLKEMVLGEVADIDQFTKDLGQIGESIRQARLTSEKQIKNRKEAIRIEIVEAGRNKLGNYIAQLSHETGYVMPLVDHDFPNSLKGKKTLTSLQSAADDELARCKIIANQSADLIRVNAKILQSAASNYPQLFPDQSRLVNEPTEHLQNTIKARIADEKERVTLEQQRTAEQEAMRQEQAQPEPATKQQAITFNVQPAPESLPVQPEPATAGETETITISQREYAQLYSAKQLLDALKVAGVTQWEGYKTALQILESGVKAA